ncbi:hypothetical protein [Yersinia mollaretii]|uniref:hypothetical protein n=1 Tax=Yersinia mollaretii TaxID=33060 RepID=UPI0021BDE9C1|nr:hypothetical protein [Yersinia mollaretii]
MVVFGKRINQIYGDGGSNVTGTTKVFASEKLSDQEIRSYALSLTGGKPLEEVRRGKVWTVSLDKNTGEKITVRNISSSADRTKARWTIEIIGNEQLNNLQGKKKNPIEIKFR